MTVIEDHHGLPLSDVEATTANLQYSETGKKGIMAAGSILGAIAASSCCILPLVLFSLGIGGAWVGNLTALYPYKPYFVTITLLFLAGGFYMAYRTPKLVCEPGAYCATPKSERVLKISLSSATLLIMAALAFPYVVPYLLG